MEPRTLRLPGADGLNLHALEWSTEGTPLLFLHGFSNTARVWDDMVERHAQVALGAPDGPLPHRPRAAVLACSDARVPPSLLFGQDPGSLFVVRLAGNSATTERTVVLDRDPPVFSESAPDRIETDSFPVLLSGSVTDTRSPAPL